MIEPKLFITEDLNTGEVVRIDDITGDYTAENTGGYGSPNPSISSVNKTRFLFSSCLTEQNAAQGVLTCRSGYEYEVVGEGVNTIVVDTKVFSLGDKFVLMTDQTPVIGAGLSLNETGRFAYTPSFLPADIFIEFVPSFYGIDSLTFPDSTYFTTYQIYTDTLSAGSANAGTYIATGNVTISGVTYRSGEVFTKSSTFSFTGADIVLFNAETEYAYPLYYYALQARDNVALKYVNGCKCDATLAAKLTKMNEILAAIQYNFENNLNNDYSGTQTLLEQIIEIS